MRYGSVCSGIEAATVAWHGLGWEPVFFSEIDKFPSAVLAHHFPEVPNKGDMTKYKEWGIARGTIDVLVGGTPCQAFSVAGLRGGLSDERGNLALTFCEIADEFDPEWVVWENVPGVLSSKDNAFGCFLAGLCGADEPLVCNGTWPSSGVVSGPKRTAAWRILDAQYFGVAQRRRRVFVLAVRGSGNWACAAALFPIGESVYGDTAPSREAQKDVAGTLAGGARKRGGYSADDIPAIASTGSISHCLNAGGMGRIDYETETMIVQQSLFSASAGNNAGLINPVIAFTTQDHGGDASVNISPTLRAGGHSKSHANAGVMSAVCITGEITHALKAEGADASEDGTGRGNPIVAVAGKKPWAEQEQEETDALWREKSSEVMEFSCNCGHVFIGTITTPCPACGGYGGVTNEIKPAAVTVSLRGRDGGATAEIGDEVGNCLRASQGGGDKPHVLTRMAVRRLTPRECERLQGFPDDWTLIPVCRKQAADGPRYKAIGNSMAVPVMRWIGERIEKVRQIY